MCRDTKAINSLLWRTYQPQLPQAVKRHQEADSKRPTPLIGNEDYFVCRDEAAEDEIQQIKVHLQHKGLIPEQACLSIEEYSMVVALNAGRCDTECKQFIDTSEARFSHPNKALGITLAIATPPHMTPKDVRLYRNHGALF